MNGVLKPKARFLRNIDYLKRIETNYFFYVGPNLTKYSKLVWMVQQSV